MRTLSDAAISENSKTLTSATAAFTDLDKAPRVVIVKGAGPGVPAGDLVSRIKKVNSATSVELEDRADTTVSGAKLELGLPIIPQEASGKFVDHIQFRGRQYFVPNGVIGGAFEPCLFDSRLCAGAVLLWR